ncbi:MAG TPA: DUF1405 domain-containing protein [Staphylococcus auricularis]|nr:DUF1405 domain-containing protein [Staphylococcus auricularis]
MTIKSLWHMLLYHKWVLWFLFICNLIGTIYGFIWYGGQLERTSWQFWLFVPDSPTASLFLTIVILSYILNKQWPVIEALAFVTLVKYGVWAVILNIIMFIDMDQVSLSGLMLIMSHGIMAIEAFFFYPRFKFSIIGLVVAMLWVFHNDVIDYVFLQYPYYPIIEENLESIAYLSLWLSAIPLILYYAMARLNVNKIFDPR